MTLHLRPITGPDEIDLFNQFPYVLNKEVAGDLTAGRRHPGWLWVALDDGELVARVGLWSRPGEDAPQVLDIFDFTDARAGEALLHEALDPLVTKPEYTRFLSPDWRADPGNQERFAVLERTGAKIFVERLRLHWEPGTPIAEPSGRLTFRQPRDAEELIGLMTRVLTGTLDAHGRDELTRMTAEQSAREQYRDELERYSSPHEWWRVAECDGEAAGFVIPAHNGYNPIIAYLAVVPELRGKGLIDDILAEGTRILAAAGMPRARAATDVGNVPMARAFDRAGYVVFERQIDMVWPG
ncbi:GNAT family N-acetyltransferase [Winogradskya consettensis]|uniref:N-acetyltransferase n=1 Tax=Winogradskya consettensis TaxID=113560 RepID=A0A919VQ49_9ACTN|nr:GNAT family N-acetyltransferase [Actinoplanes consettensis]GIM74529.1 N-acetyltransferase [Actinoplanes consettensis]